MANYSAGGSGYSQTFFDALVAARDAGVLYVAAAGNDAVDNDVTPHYPSSYDVESVIAVAATDSLDSLAYFSSWGPISVDLGAPGLFILSTVPPFAPAFLEDFEAVSPPDLGYQFTLDGPANYWGTVNTGEGNIVARGDAEYSYPYRPNADGWIVSPPLDTSDLRGLSFSFDWRCQMEEDDDALIMELWDGAAWQPRTRISTSDSWDGSWWGTFGDLGRYQHPALQLRFGWQTDADFNDFFGAEIDNVTIWNIGSDYTSETAYGTKSGTSMATPHVTGAAALLLAHRPDMCLTELRNRLVWTGDAVPGLDGITVSGRRLNVYAALTAPSDLAVLVPDGGEHWRLGSTHVIGWSMFDCDSPDTVDIFLLNGGSVHTQVADDVPNTGAFVWSVPEDLPAAGDYRILVDDGTDVDESDGDFSLRPPGLILYVDDDAPEGGDGASWNTAYKHLQDALGTASIGDDIHVAGGVYKPDLDEAGTVTPGDRAATFLPVGGVGIYGGYAGLANPADPDLRDLNLYESILSGDLAGDDGPVHVEELAACFSGSGIPLRAACEAFDFDGDLDVDGDDKRAFLVANHYTENSCHVLTGSMDLEPAVVDGFTVVAGYASGELPYHGTFGGGMYNPSSSSPIVTNCTFRGNAAIGDGGGMFNRYYSSPTVTDCRFIGNVTTGRGGGMRSQDVSSLTVANCKFSENAANDGGGISLLTDNAMLYDCTFAGNTAGFGGGAYIDGDPILVNCIFQGNLSGSYGGGLMTIGDPVLTNCTFTGNEATVMGGSLFNWFDGSPTLTNCILWGNEPDGFYTAPDAYPVITFSNIQDGTGQPWFGPGCIDLNPWFIDADGPDNDLATEDDNVRLSADSPCIDAGDDSAVTVLTDPDGRARILDGDGDGTLVVDMGAYEFTPDCNDNGVSDDDDVAAGTSPDCNANNVPDECEPVGANDCNTSGTTDWCDIEGGFAEDCNANWIPDDCDMADGSSIDCNINGIPDECDIADETSQDCNSSNVPDECEPGGLDDCDNNGTTDLCEIYAGSDTDCNENWIPDDCDLAGGTSEDCNADDVPDECEPGGSTDCNNNGTSDLCDIYTGASEDCNGNVSPDECDVSDGASLDENANGIPDECECFPSSAAQPERLDLPGDPASQKVRYMSFAAGDTGRLQAIRVTFADIPTPYEHWIGTQLWVQRPQEYCENAGAAQAMPCPTQVGGLPDTDFWGAMLGCELHWDNWTEYGPVHVFNEGIIPGGEYDIQIIDSPCSLDVEDNYSAALMLTQSTWADAVKDCSTTPCGPPDGSTGIVDVTAILDKYKNLPGNVIKARADIEGSPAGDARLPDQAINITDVTFCLGAFLGETYPPPGFPEPGDPPACP